MSSELFYTIGGLLLIYGGSTIIATTLTDALMDYFGNMAMQEFYRKKTGRNHRRIFELSKPREEEKINDVGTQN